LSVNLGWTRGHGSLLLDLSYFPAVGHPEVIHFIRHRKRRVPGAPGLAVFARPFGSAQGRLWEGHLECSLVTDRSF
jgi:hypothetical protein